MPEELAAIDPRIIAIRTIIHDALIELDQLHVDVTRIDETTSMRSLPVDSMTVIELIDQLNSTFDAQLRPEDVYAAATVGDLLRLMPR
ncbi:acyl carrier protein [Nocardia niigatensis]